MCAENTSIDNLWSTANAQIKMILKVTAHVPILLFKLSSVDKISMVLGILQQLIF